ncbi:hypothetical protein [Paraburkholderia hospita]
MHPLPGCVTSWTLRDATCPVLVPPRGPRVPDYTADGSKLKNPVA